MLLVRKALGYKGPIRVAADPVALLPAIRRPVDRNKVVLSLARENLNHANLVASAEMFCRTMSSAGREVILLVMDARAGEETDVYDILVERIKQSVRIPSLITYIRYSNFLRQPAAWFHADFTP